MMNGNLLQHYPSCYQYGFQDPYYRERWQLDGQDTLQKFH
jgi:hypothetical protein